MTIASVLSKTVFQRVEEMDRISGSLLSIERFMFRMAYATNAPGPIGEYIQAA
jgi:hypothetical protein